MKPMTKEQIEKIVADEIYKYNDKEHIHTLPVHCIAEELKVVIAQAIFTYISAKRR